jgi:hypothetical protein
MTSNLYCQPCDISFTSVPHATQHYQGKNHAKKLKSLAASDQTPNCGSQNSSGNQSDDINDLNDSGEKGSHLINKGNCNS